MQSIRRYCNTCGLVVSLFCLTVLSLSSQALAQPVSGEVCKPISERTGELGCWILAHDKGARGTVVDSLGKVWLLTIAEGGWRPLSGERIAEIGPLPIAEGETYSAQYMEAIFTPGMTSRAHIHSGPEAWYTLTGETCLETPQGKQVGRAGGQYVIVPGGPPMHLTATGTETRRAIVLILHDSSKPASTPVYDWTPKGLCKN